MKQKKFRYLDIYQDLKHRIEENEFGEGFKLPSESELANSYFTSKITVNHALKLLKDEGYIRRVQGKGSFVLLPEERRNSLPETANALPKLVGLVLEHVSTPFGLDMMYAMSKALDAKGYILLVRFSFGNIKKEKEEIETLLAMGVKGLILMPCHDSYYSSIILRMIVDKFPVILVDKRMQGLRISSVCTDGFEAIRKLIHHLHAQGVKQSALLSVAPSSTSSLGDRADGFFKGLSDCGMQCSGSYIMPQRNRDLTDYSLEYYQEIQNIFRNLKQLPESIVCTEYDLGRTLHKVCMEKGIVLGRDIKACCIDEDYLAVGGYQFTHMRQDEQSIAQKAVEILLSQLEGAPQETIDLKVPSLFFQGRTT